MKQLILTLSLLLTFGCNSHKLTDKPIDLCPSDEGLSCPIDGSPCPFCGRTLITNN
jgi:hypothetical protein